MLLRENQELNSLTPQMKINTTVTLVDGQQ